MNSQQESRQNYQGNDAIPTYGSLSNSQGVISNQQIPFRQPLPSTSTLDTKFDFSRVNDVGGANTNQNSVLIAAAVLFLTGIVLTVFAVIIVSKPLEDYDATIFFISGLLCSIPGAYYLYKSLRPQTSTGFW